MSTCNQQMSINEANIIPLAILDWDDTLFPTTQLKQRQLHSFDNVRLLMESVYQLLIKYIRTYGSSNVVIVTNASRGWVLQSLQLLNKITNQKIPCIAAIIQLLSEGTLTAFSAKKNCAKKYPNRPHLWKRMMFIQLLKKHFVRRDKTNEGPSPLYTFICVGDSDIEYNESLKATTYIKEKHDVDITLTRLKLKKNPTVENMVNQIKLIESVVLLSTRNHG